MYLTLLDVNRRWCRRHRFCLLLDTVPCRQSHEKHQNCTNQYPLFHELSSPHTNLLTSLVEFDSLSIKVNRPWVILLIEFIG